MNKVTSLTSHTHKNKTTHIHINKVHLTSSYLTLKYIDTAIFIWYLQK